MRLKSDLLTNILYKKNWNMSRNNSLEKSITVKQISPKSIVDLIVSSDMFPLFVHSLNGLDESNIYSSNVHGLNHLERVSLFAFFICLVEKKTLLDVQIILEIAQYHDIGRINERRDFMHGFRGAEKYRTLNRITDKSDLNVVMTVIAAHSISDEKFDSIYKYYYGTDQTQYNRVFHIYQIIKDADGLDRFRLGKKQLDIQMLRLDSSKRIVQFSYEINQL